MAYLGMVVKNTKYSDNEPPYIGCIQVVCPQLFGMQKGIPKDIKAKDTWKYGLLSDWIYPINVSPSDFFVPDIGDTVIIEELVGTGRYLWRGCPYKLDENNYLLSDQKMEPYPMSAEIVPNEYKTRIIGDKNGSRITFYDSWIKDRDGGRTEKFSIVVGGSNNLEEDRKGVELVIDATEDEESLQMLVQDSSGETAQSVVINNKKDSGFIELLDRQGQYIVIDSEEESITLEDKHGNIIIMDKDGIKIESSKELNIKTSDDIKIDAGSNNIEVKAMEVTLEATTDITIKNSTQKIEMGASSTKISGVMGTVEVM
jgi:hypothetical protein